MKWVYEVIHSVAWMHYPIIRVRRCRRRVMISLIQSDYLIREQQDQQYVA